jgi:hypothetical protein
MFAAGLCIGGKRSLGTWRAVLKQQTMQKDGVMNQKTSSRSAVLCCPKN